MAFVKLYLHLWLLSFTFNIFTLFLYHHTMIQSQKINITITSGKWQQYNVYSLLDPERIWFDLIWFDLLCLTPLSAIFQLYNGDHFNGGRNRGTRRKPPTMGKQLVNIITCIITCTLFVIYKAGRDPTPYWW